MNKKFLFLFTALLTCTAAKATDYFVAELSGTTLTFKKTTTEPDNETSWDATNTGTSPGWLNSSISAIVLDPSFADARPTSCYSWFSAPYNALSGVAERSITGLEYLNTSNVTDMRYMFQNCVCLTTPDFSHFDTRNVTNMSCMFLGCGGLTSIDLSSFDTSNVTDMSNMFQECWSLTSLDVSSFNTSKVTNMASMFNACSLLTSLDLRNFDTRNVTRMDFMFLECQRLASLNINSFDTHNVRKMCCMFENCSALTSIDLSSFGTSNVTDMSQMFYGCSSLTSLDLSNFDTSNLSYYSELFYGCSNLTSLTIFDTSTMTDISGLFANCTGLTSIDLSHLNTSNVTNMASLFVNCTGLTSLDFSSIDTHNVTNMSAMFEGCTGLTSLDLSSFDTANVKNMRDMFRGCTNLSLLNLSSFDTHNVEDMSYLFYDCNNLLSLDLGNFDTSNVTDMQCMFEDCNSLITLDLNNFNTSKVTRMDDLLRGCSNLAFIDLNSFDTSKVTGMSRMFCDCNSLVSLDLNSFDTSNVTRMDGMFTRCTNLQTIIVGDNWNVENLTLYEWSTIFDKCYAIIGGKGTTYNGAYIVKQYAHIDGGTDNPGYLCAAVVLANATDNISIISSYAENKVKATLADRTLYKDGSWNTICLPFDVDLTDTNSPLYGATVKELDTEAGTYDHVTGFENGTLYLNFKDVTTTMTAGTPYIIKWANGDDIVNPAFLPVNISNATNNVTSTDGKVTFTGTYAPVSITESGDNTKLYLGDANTLYYPNDEMTIGCQRAYFQLNGITAGETASGGGIKAFVLNFGDGTTGITSLSKEERSRGFESWFTLDGRKLDGKPTMKGLYIHNGHKVVMP